MQRRAIMVDAIIKLAESVNWEYVITILTIIGSSVAIIVNVVMSKKQRTADIVTKNRMDWIQQFRLIISEYYATVKLFEDQQAPESTSDFLHDLYVSESAIKLQLNCFGKYDELIIKYVTEINKSYDAFLHKALLIKRLNDKAEISREMIEYVATYNPELLNEVTAKTSKKYNMQQMLMDNDYEKIIEVFTSEEFRDVSIINLIKMEDSYIKECCKVIRFLPEILLIYSQIYLKVEWERVKKESEKGNLKRFDFDKIFENFLGEKLNDVNKYKQMLPKRVIQDANKLPIMFNRVYKIVAIIGNIIKSKAKHY